MTYNILLADDDPDFRQQARQGLQNAGFHVTEAESEHQANGLVRHQQFDLAVVNLILENSDSGFTLSYHLKRSFPNMPVVMLSSAAGEYGMDFSTETAAGRTWIKADVLLNKPVRTEQLLHAVQRLLPQ